MTRKGSIEIYLSQFIEYKKGEVNETSLHTYMSELRLFRHYLEEKKVINNAATFFTTDFITDFLHDLADKKKLSRLTILKYEQLLHSFFAFLRLNTIL